HEGDERPGRRGERSGVEALDVMRSERGDGRGDSTMCDRDPGGAGDGRERRDAWNDLERHAGIGERERLLPAAAEEERVAALESHDVVSATAERDEQLVDLLLLETVSLDPQCVGGRLVDELGSDEAVVDDHVARTDALEALDRDQPGIAWTGADEGDAHPSAFVTALRK